MKRTAKLEIMYASMYNCVGLDESRNILRKILDCTFMASEEREPITGLWGDGKGLGPSRVQGQSPCSGPLKPKTF